MSSSTIWLGSARFVSAMSVARSSGRDFARRASKSFHASSISRLYSSLRALSGCMARRASTCRDTSRSASWAAAGSARPSASAAAAAKIRSMWFLFRSDDDVAPRPFRRVEAPIGRREQRIPVGPFIRIQRNTPARGHAQRLAAGAKLHPGKRLAHALGRLDGPLARAARGEHHQELLAADAREDVLVALGRGERGRGGLQHFVAHGVAAGVVHPLEVVEVEERDGEPFLVARGARNLFLEA